MVGGLAVQKYGMALEKNQEVLSNLADIMIQIFAAESGLLRTQKQIEKAGEEKAKNAIQITTVFVHEAFDKIEAYAKEALSTMEEGDVLRTQLSILKKLSRRSSVNTVGLKRDIAARVIEGEKFIV